MAKYYFSITPAEFAVFRTFGLYKFVALAIFATRSI